MRPLSRSALVVGGGTPPNSDPPVAQTFDFGSCALAFFQAGTSKAGTGVKLKLVTLTAVSPEGDGSRSSLNMGRRLAGRSRVRSIPCANGGVAGVEVSST